MAGLQPRVFRLAEGVGGLDADRYGERTRAGSVEDPERLIEQLEITGIGHLVVQGSEIAQHRAEEAGAAGLLGQRRPGTQAVQSQLEEPVHLRPTLLVQNAGKEEHHLAPFRPVESGRRIEEQPGLFRIGPPGDGAGREVLLEGEVPERHLVAAADDDPGIELFLVEETLGLLDGVPARRLGRCSPLAGSLAEFRRENLGRQAAGKLDLPAREVVLHVEGELLQECKATLGARPAGALLARARQPVQDGIVEIGTLLREAALVPVHHRERRQHHGIAGEPPDLGPTLQCGGQLRAMGLRLVRALRVQGPAPAPQEHPDGLVLQGLNVSVLKAGELGLPGVGGGPAGHDEPRLRIGPGQSLDEPAARLARRSVWSLVETVEQDAGPGF